MKKLLILFVGLMCLCGIATSQQVNNTFFGELPITISYEVVFRPNKDYVNDENYPVKVNIQKAGKVIHGTCELSNGNKSEAWIYEGVWLRELDDGTPVAFSPHAGAMPVKSSPPPLLKGYLSEDNFPELSAWLEGVRCVGEKNIEGVLCDLYVSPNAVHSGIREESSQQSNPIVLNPAVVTKVEEKKNKPTLSSSKGNRYSTKDEDENVEVVLNVSEKPLVQYERKQVVQNVEVVVNGLYVDKNKKLPFIFKDDRGEWRYRFSSSPVNLRLSGKWLNALNRYREDAGLPSIK